jgi:hypothetical protein
MTQLNVWKTNSTPDNVKEPTVGVGKNEFIPRCLDDFITAIKGPSTTPSNEEPGKKYDQDKLRYDLLEPLFEELIVKVLTFGGKKYGDHNWKKVEPYSERYYAACRRHIAAWRKGEKTDKETGLPHLAHAATCLYFILMRDMEGEQNECKCN